MSLAELFDAPELLPVLLLAPLAWGGLWLLDRARARRLAGLLGPRAPALARELRNSRRRLRRLLASMALLLALLALLRPRWGEGPPAAAPRGVDIVVCLDVSRSMLARDVAPSRLLAAKAQLAALAERARGDRLGLVVFAGEAWLLVPLTQDIGSWVQLAGQADPLSVGRGGTDLGAALEAARAALGGARGDHEAIVLLTDGEDHAGTGRAAAERCGEQGIAVHCLGFGSPRGSKVPVEVDGGEAFLRDRTGRDVVSAHDPASLRALAEAAGGHYLDASADPGALAALHRARIQPMARKAFEAALRAERQHRFQWPLLGALVLWLLELCITDRRQPKAAART